MSNDSRLIFLCLLAGASAKLCYVPNQGIELPIMGTSKTNVMDSSLVQCPRPEDPSHLSDCCLSGDSPCCERPRHPAALTIFGLSEEILIAISVCVITVCLISTMLVLVCCFWSKCPLYSCAPCRINYQHEEAIAFSTKEEMMKLNGMPDDEGHPNQQSFEPNAIKIRSVSDF